MSNSLIQSEITTKINIKKERELKDRQAKCQHNFIDVSYFDFENDRVYSFVVCKFCGFQAE
jgi:hypothetical protein